MTEIKTNRNHKDSVFTRLFSEKSNLLELYSAVRIYNINKGRNAEMASRSQALSGYEEFIAEIKENLKSMELREAIKLAVKACISKNILVSFLERHGSEIENMIFGEWSMDDALAVAREEEREECNAEHQQQMRELFSLWRQGYSVDEAEKKFAAPPKSHQ